MSEPMSNVEIEDVLSSIRRLVSQDNRAAPRATAAPVAQAPEPPLAMPDNKLLLTPALRVVSDRPAPAAAGAPRAPLPRLHLGIETPQAQSFAPMADLSEAEFESETGDPYPDAARMEWTEDGWVLAATEAVSPFPAPESPAPWAQEEFSEAASSDADLPPQSAAAAAAEAAWADHAEAEVMAELDAARAASPAEPAQPQPQTQASAPDEGDPLEVVFDEQVLREMVREILRDELQGRLGERITRNIRKLVHAEIARLVAAQELD